MRVRTPILGLLFYCALLPGWAEEPSFAQPAASLPDRASAPVAMQFRMGQSLFSLNGPWKFTVGDSPLDRATGQPLWAEPGFDDSKWENVDLTPREGAIDPTAGISGYVPGWTAKGHRGYWGYGWYRIRLRILTRPGEKLAIAGPSNVDDAYQLFVNGALLGSFGNFSRGRPVIYYSQPIIFPLPASVNRSEESKDGSPADGSVTAELAFRVWMEPHTLKQLPDAGGIHTAPLLGDAGILALGYQSQWLEVIRAYATNPLDMAVFLLLGLGAFSLTFFDRTDRVYLWMGTVFLVWTAVCCLTMIGTWTQLLGGETSNAIIAVLLNPPSYACWVMVWWIWFGLRRPAWLPSAAFALALLLALSNALGGDFFFSLVSQPVSNAFHIVTLAVRLIFLAILLWIVAQGIRLQGVEGWLALPAVVLLGIARYSRELALLHIRVEWFPMGVQINLGVIASLLMAGVLVVLLMRRLLASLKKQRQMALDVQQAQQLQLVIVPRERIHFGDLEIESLYRPAREVGGDFFQIIQHPTDGSLLIVAGDVSGKGLRAGMLVALVVGAIRTAAQYEDEPLDVLHTLNQRLCGQSDAQATSLALRIEATGAVTLANAGHLPPYLNGEALPMEGALPLGMLTAAEFSVMRFNLAEGDRLLLLSDGIVEATDASGQLFGFERVHELLKTQPSIAQLADAAQAFGQEDDISVISVHRAVSAGLVS
ncbi:MAG: SpoIIE family protein phosphatase [Terracidiphilus sp.]